mgnify:CR=1 FL=1
MLPEIRVQHRELARHLHRDNQVAEHAKDRLENQFQPDNLPLGGVADEGGGQEGVSEPDSVAERPVPGAGRADPGHEAAGRPEPSGADRVPQEHPVVHQLDPQVPAAQRPQVREHAAELPEEHLPVQGHRADRDLFLLLRQADQEQPHGQRIPHQALHPHPK